MLATVAVSVSTRWEVLAPSSLLLYLAGVKL
jgi:hypothetical protein